VTVAPDPEAVATAPASPYRWDAEARNVSWGFADQALSSATNFGLSVLAGQTLGPAGLGVVFVGFVGYLVPLGFQRALLTEPLVASSAARSPETRARIARCGLTLALLGALAATAVLTIVGLAVSGRIGRGLLLFAPWLVPLLLQDFWRSVLFRDRRGIAATMNDGAWLVAMAAAAPLVLLTQSEWIVVASWGAGAAAGAALGFAQMRAAPERLRVAVDWWRAEAWPLGRWLGTSSLFYAVTSYATIAVLVEVLGTRQVGGLQAVISVFAPLSLVSSALAFPGLPAIARALVVSIRRARKLAAGLSLTAVAGIAVYMAVLNLSGKGLLGFFFGRSFRGFSSLVWPVASGQLAAGAAIGFFLLLKAQKRGRAVMLAGAVGWVATPGLATWLAVTHGLNGAAWGLSASAALSGLVAIVLALTRGRTGAVAGADELSPAVAYSRPEAG
jgi:O-antigen/teichoic acid export membrane protein